MDVEMSILETNKIDLVARKPNSKVVKLVIADHLTWEELDAHKRLIQDKINTYLEFVESGKLLRMKEPIIPPSPEVWVTLALKYKPSEEAKVFLFQVEEFLKQQRLVFEVQHPA